MPSLTVNNLTKTFKIGALKRQGVLANLISLISGRETKKVFTALKNISFQTSAGEFLGLIGDNGAGKSTLLRCLAGIYPADSGEIKTFGPVVSLIELNDGFKSRLSAKDNLFLCGALLGLTKKEIKERLDEIINFAELQNFVDTKIYQFSGGMVERLAFSLAIFAQPKILLLDELFNAVDLSFQAKALAKLKTMVQSGITIILASHDLETIKTCCDKIIWLKAGTIFKIGQPKEIIEPYQAQK
ncbi:MAG: ATP-binding cassette domain-containing protein [Patescibacteria group bacterium]|jgi:ABC-type polysaccharide/polyol phosphate transport system ATPase subunit